jgi:hypothetical protein
MNYYANDEQRIRLIAGLHDLADFLERNPGAPVPRQTSLLVFPPEASDAEMFAEIDTIAGLIGSTASDDGSPNGHYGAVRSFGPVQYRAVAIPHRAREKGGE